MTISIDAENAFDKIHHAFMKKVLENGWLEGTHLNSMKAIGEKPTANIIIDGEKLKAIVLNSGMRQDCPLPIPFQHCAG